MPLSRFDHVNILSGDIEATREFFVAVLELRVGARPPFRTPGYWLYAGDVAIVHISDARLHEQTHVTDIGAVQPGAGGAVDHIAFRCTGYHETKARLERLGIACHEADVPAAADHQVFVDGPGGVTLELIFAAADVAGTASGSALVAG